MRLETVRSSEFADRQVQWKCLEVELADKAPARSKSLS
jgi:hypothetical protein